MCKVKFIKILWYLLTHIFTNVIFRLRGYNNCFVNFLLVFFINYIYLYNKNYNKFYKI